MRAIFPIDSWEQPKIWWLRTYCSDVLDQFTTSDFNRRLEFDRESLNPFAGITVALVDVDSGESVAALGSLPCVVIGRTEPNSGGRESANCDVTVDDDRVLDDILTTIERSPQAALATVLLLRGVEQRTVEQSLIAESSTYSMLQAGAEFAQWRSGRIRRDSDSSSQGSDDGAIVIGERIDDHLSITLNRPERRNAYSSSMRTALAELLRVAVIDHSIVGVSLRGAGTNFSSGGDLDEFGSFTDPVLAHLSRLTSNVGSMLDTLRQRLGRKLRCEMHGENFGAGVEIPAFAGWVTATPDTKFCLPEIALGLVPGAGGTASLPLRIGRQRTAELALTGRAIDAKKALHWGLIDELSG